MNTDNRLEALSTVAYGKQISSIDYRMFFLNEESNITLAGNPNPYDTANLKSEDTTRKTVVGTRPKDSEENIREKMEAFTKKLFEEPQEEKKRDAKIYEGLV